MYVYLIYIENFCFVKKKKKKGIEVIWEVMERGKVDCVIDLFSEFVVKLYISINNYLCDADLVTIKQSFLNRIKHNLKENKNNF
jgi:hypothetical protein